MIEKVNGMEASPKSPTKGKHVRSSNNRCTENKELAKTTIGKNVPKEMKAQKEDCQGTAFMLKVDPSFFLYTSWNFWKGLKF